MHVVRRIIAGVGRTFISVGILVLLFVVYELWGTGLAEARSQDALKKKLRAPTATTVPRTTQKVTVPAPPEGDAIGIIKIPKIGVEKAFVEGTGVPDLKKGPGHYSGTPMPGEAGNAAIAGHRTTYGAPFYRVDELVPGDQILVSTRAGAFQYAVKETKIVGPDDNFVLNDTPDNRLTLTTCHPRYSAAQRMIIIAGLQGPVSNVVTEREGGAQGLASDEGSTGQTVVPPPGVNKNTPTSGPPRGQTSQPTRAGIRIGNLSGVKDAYTSAIMWGLAAGAIWLITWAFSHWWRRWPAYLLGAPVFLVVLFVFFENFASLLPANV